jgi:hypothetical protein
MEKPLQNLSYQSNAPINKPEFFYHLNLNIMNSPNLSPKPKLTALIFVISSLLLFSCNKDMDLQNCGTRTNTAEIKAAEAITDNFKFDYDFTAFIDCANGGTGEEVIFSGTLHALTHLTMNNNSFTFKSHYQPQGIQGVGAITGDLYQATGVTQSTTNGSFVNGSYTDIFVNNFKLIGQGTDNNFIVHDTFKVTINANGIVTVEFGKSSFDCK